MTVCIHANTRSDDGSNWHSEIHRGLYKQQNFITCQMLFLVLVREILLCETSGCMRGMDVEDIGHRVSWHGSFCTIVRLVGNMLSNAPPWFQHHATMSPSVPSPTRPMHFTSRIPVQKKGSDVNTWGCLGSQKSELSLRLLWFQKIWVSSI